MTTQEFSNMFDTILNSYATQSSFGDQAAETDIVLDEYEKSVLLTQAQDIVVKSYFEGIVDGKAIDDTTRRQIDFSTLIKVTEPVPVTTTTTTTTTTTYTVSTSNDGNGVAYAVDSSILAGSSTTILAVPSEGYEFDKWEDENTDNPRTVIPTANAQYKALFKTKEPLGDSADKVTITGNAESNGNVYGTSTVLAGSSVYLIAIPNNGYRFKEWTDGDTSNPRTIIAGSDTFFTAKFETIPADALTVALPVKYVYNNNGILYKMPFDVLFMLNEMIEGTVNGRTKRYVVVPINYKEYDRQMTKAYSQPLKKQCWRLFQTTANETVCEVIPIAGVTVATYRIRYVKRPRPIVLTDISADGLTIDGVNKEQGCELNPVIHVDILNKAVELAMATRRNSASQQEQRQGQRQTGYQQ